mmetsp:Transcript_47273/g.122164  ORF Transcript_47273/g.122164 Transcript_47273/m.122164 type:complete len:107 (+) Transcript_47273:119-439(+)
MAMGEMTRFVMVALIAMVAYRFVNELQPNSPDKVSGEQATEAMGHAVESDSSDSEAQEGEAIEASQGPEVAKTKKGKAGVAGGKSNSTKNKFNLGKDQVLIEYCTS